MRRELGRVVFTLGMALLILSGIAPLLGMDPAETVINAFGAFLSLILLVIGAVQILRR